MDASVVLSWAFRDEATPFTLSVLEFMERGQAIAPSLWPFEIVNGLSIAERTGRMTAEEQIEFLDRLWMLPIMIERRPAAWLAQQILPITRTYGLSAYDAAYLELAIREDLPLATLDDDLRKAALSARVSLHESTL